MASMNSKVKRAFDAEAAVTLRNATDGAETSTAAETGVALDRLSQAYWDNGEIANGVFDVNVHVTALDVADADETYVLTVEVDSTVGFASTVIVGTLNVGAPGYYNVVLDSDTMKSLDDAAAFIRINATLGGTTPSITYGAWMGPPNPA